MRLRRSRLGEIAELELEEAFEWYSGKSLDAAAGFLGDFQKALRMAEQFPDAGKVLEGELRHFPLSRYPYYLVYVPHQTVVYVVALGHSGRGVPYWRTAMKRPEK